MGNTNVAILMTCHNRRQNTLDSLSALFNQVTSEEVTLCVYLVDDASTDGTAVAVRYAYPQVTIINGNGSLFWNGGMRLAFAEAIKSDPDYYLWLNDDTVLYPEALATLLTVSHNLAEQGYVRAIVAGSTCDPETGMVTYGGVVRSSWWHPLHFHLVEPSKEAKRCDTMHGNCVLLPRQVIQVMGNIHPAFVHSMGDWDYGLRTQRQGCTVWIAPGYVGTCKQNPIEGDCWGDLNLSLGERLKKVSQPKGLRLEEWKVFTQQHAGPLWSVYWLLPYVRLVLISVFGRPMGYRA